ncbi:hypothetical protein PHYC_03764 [Phycisphaerales bacterium]|nr:hypothetical protein PHYC_03764 [Phycisphaerales bacterium]
MPQLNPAFLKTDAWLKLSAGAQAALKGLLQFAIPRSAEWTVDGSAAQVAAWLGEESGLGRKAVQDGLTELENARLLKRGFGGNIKAGFVITAPVTE